MHVRSKVQENGPTKRTGDFRFLEIHETYNRALTATGPADHPIEPSEQHMGHYTACFGRHLELVTIPGGFNNTLDKCFRRLKIGVWYAKSQGFVSQTPFFLRS
jgi:hypothetical protein